MIGLMMVRNSVRNQIEELTVKNLRSKLICYIKTLKFQNVMYVVQSIIGQKNALIHMKLKLNQRISHSQRISKCTKAVCGQVWYDCCLQSLCNEDQHLVRHEKSETSFGFGNGRVFKTIKCVTLPTFKA